MVYYCSIENCNNHGSPKSANALHKIPIEEPLRSIWIDYIRNSNNCPEFLPWVSTRICSLHFVDCFKRPRNGRELLLPEAYPGTIVVEDIDKILNINHLKQMFTSKVELKNWFYDVNSLRIFNLKDDKVNFMLKIGPKLDVEIYVGSHIQSVHQIETFSEVSKYLEVF